MTARSERSLLDGLSALAAVLDPELRSLARESWEDSQKVSAYNRLNHRAPRGYRVSSSSVPATHKAARTIERSY